MSIFEKLFARPNHEAPSYPELLLVHLHGRSEAEAEPLEEALQPLLQQLPANYSSGSDLEGSETTLYISTEDARATLAHLLPFLRTHELGNTADLTLQTRIPNSTGYETTSERFPVQSERATTIAAASTALHGGHHA